MTARRTLIGLVPLLALAVCGCGSSTSQSKDARPALRTAISSYARNLQGGGWIDTTPPAPSISACTGEDNRAGVTWRMPVVQPNYPAGVNRETETTHNVLAQAVGTFVRMTEERYGQDLVRITSKDNGIRFYIQVPDGRYVELVGDVAC